MTYSYEFVDVTVPNGQENQEKIVLEPVTVTRHIVAIASQVSDDAADLLVNFGRDRTVDVPSTAIDADTGWLEIDQDLLPGVGLELGFRNNTGAALTAQWIAVKYTVA